MYLHGEFVNRQGNTVKVEILTQGSRTPDYEIESEAAGIWFTDDPVEIVSEVNDTFDPVLTHSATIRLESSRELTGLYCSSCMDAVVNIRVNGKCIFAGFVEPQSYSQGFNESTDEVEVNCIDALSALQYFPYAGIGSTTSYDEIKTNADDKDLMTLLKGALQSVATSLDISEGEQWSLAYDGSKSLRHDSPSAALFQSIGISELLFIGDDEDSVWTEQDVISEIMRYLGLHIEQEGMCFYIFSWSSAKKGFVNWQQLTNNGGADSSWFSGTTKEISLNNVADDETTISIGETFNLISLTDEIKEAETILESPLSDESIVSPYLKRQKYVTTFSCTRSANTFWNWIKGNHLNDSAYPTYYNKEFGSIKDWYMRVKDNPNWTFYTNIGLQDLYKAQCAEGTKPQEDLPNAIGNVNVLGFSAALISWGSVEKLPDLKDNSPVSKIDMSDYLVVAVNGAQNRTTEDLDTLLQTCAPVAVYNGPSSGSMLTPADDVTTNYIVISGSIRLTPICQESFAWKDQPSSSVGFPDRYWVEWKDGARYYTREWWKTAFPCGPVSEDPDNLRGLTPPDEEGPELYEFNYTSIGNSNDNISKVPVLACMLIVGDKCLVEKDPEGQVGDFEWRSYKKRSQCSSDDEYYEQTFTIGFDPKIGDKIIGPEYPIQNNVSFDLGLDIEGMAIPVKRSDALFGKVEFQILGPVNGVWNEVFYKHRTWFRTESWSTNAVRLLEKIQNIYIKDFQVKLYSDNSMNEVDDDCNLVYMSDTDERYVNKKDDISFKLTSALTAGERAQLGIRSTLNLSTPILISEKTGLLEIYDRNRMESGKPEQLYVEEAWREWHEPRVQMNQTIRDDASALKRFDRFTHPALVGKTFYIQGISRNLLEGEATLNLKESEL